MLLVWLFGFTVEVRDAVVIARLVALWAVTLGFIELVVKLKTEPYVVPPELTAYAQK